MCWHFVHFGGCCPWSRIELADVHHWEVVVLHQVNRIVKLLVGLAWETTNDVSGDGQFRHVLNQVVANFLEICHGILPVHLFKYDVISTLNRNVDK